MRRQRYRKIYCSLSQRFEEWRKTQAMRRVELVSAVFAGAWAVARGDLVLLAVLGASVAGGGRGGEGLARYNGGMRRIRKNIWLPIAVAAAGAGFVAFGPEAKAKSEDPLIAAYEKATIASVADAVDQIVGERGYMNHDMRPRALGKFAGRAATALLRPAPKDKATAPLSAKHSVEMIDNAKPGEVGVIVIEGGLDVAAMGGLMGTDAKARGLAGMVLDASVRDLAELRALNLPVFARGVVPSTTVSRFASVGRNIPVTCAGVLVKPGDIIVAGEDGVVRVPQEHAAAVLKRSQEIDERETKMVPLILKHKSLQKVVEIFNRI